MVWFERLPHYAQPDAFGQPQRRRVGGLDDRDDAFQPEVVKACPQGRERRFGRIAMSPVAGVESPTDLDLPL